MKPKNDKLHPLMWLVVGLSLLSVIVFGMGLLLPPAGEGHPSVLKGLGIMTANITLVIFAYAIATDKTATFKHGNTSATVGGKQKADKQKQSE